MKRNTLNFVVDGVSALVLFGLIATGLVIRFTLPPGSGSARALWGLGRHDWGDVHFWMAASAASLLVVHVALHWSWICVTVQRLVRGGSSPSGQPAAMARNLYGIGFLLLLVGLFGGFLWVANSSVGPTQSGRPAGQRGMLAPDEPEHPGTGGDVGSAIRGSMTLNEVAAATGIPVETFKTQLGLPATASADERLGSLMQQYGFRMSQVRRVVEQGKPKE